MSTKLADKSEFRLAWAAIVLSGAFFAAAAPFATRQLGQAPAFVPTYVSALIICDTITSALLFCQFSFLRSRALLALASGYLFTAATTAFYALMFPGLYSTAGLLGAGSQSTSAMYIFWHSGFPLFVISYSLLKRGKIADEGSNPAGASARGALWFSVVAVLSLVIGFTLFATAGREYLPVFIEGDRTSELGHVMLAGVWLLGFLALIVLLWRRPYTVVDLWLIVVMLVWLFDIGLAAVLNTGRYDLGWYAGRIYGLAAGSALLVMLLVENGRQYAQLVRMSERLSEANRALEQLSMQDGLTRIANRRSFDRHLDAQISIARRHKRELALILFDVDEFKLYNDHYGHPAGDTCLKQVAAVLQACCGRPADMAARYGGEEFALILPDTDLAGAVMIAQAVREGVEMMHLPHARAAASFVTVSGGVARFQRTDDGSAAPLIEAADESLFEAKRSGRNRIVCLAMTDGGVSMLPMN